MGFFNCWFTSNLSASQRKSQIITLFGAKRIAFMKFPFQKDAQGFPLRVPLSTSFVPFKTLGCLDLYGILKIYFTRMIWMFFHRTVECWTEQKSTQARTLQFSATKLGLKMCWCFSEFYVQYTLSVATSMAMKLECCLFLQNYPPSHPL